MATTYYVDPAGSNTAPYDTWAKAAQTVKTVVAIPPAAGDIIYCRTHEHIASEIDLASSGTNAGGWIKLIGCNAAGNVDGTRYVINGDAAGINILDFNTQDMWWLENIEVINTGAGVKYGFYSSSSSSNGIIFINCCANSCGIGFGVSNCDRSAVIRSVAYSNTYDGISLGNYSIALLCASHANGRDGIAMGYLATVYGCISHGNTDDGIVDVSPSSLILNSVIDSNTDDGIEIAATALLYSPIIIGCRITNHSGAGDNGLITFDEPCIVGWSYFEDNDDNIAGAAHDAAPAVTFQFIPIENGTTTTNLEDLANTNEGYAAAVAGHNFATNYVDSGDPDLRRVAITIPWS